MLPFFRFNDLPMLNLALSLTVALETVYSFSASLVVAGCKRETLIAIVNLGFSFCYGFAATKMPLKVVFVPTFGFGVSNFTLDVVNSVRIRLADWN